MARKSYTAAEAGIEVGTIFYTSWGYDETHTEFYKVVGISPSGKSVKVQQWSAAPAEGGWVGRDAIAAGDGPCQVLVRRYENPGEGPVYLNEYADAPIETKRLVGSADSPAIKFEGYRYGWPWKGETKTVTALGWGR